MNHRTLACTAAAVAVLATATACKPTTTTGSSGSNPTATTRSDSKTTTKKTVPSFTGMGLQSAQDTAQKQGFYTLKSHDALGRARMQAFDRNWKVCSQNIKPGTVAATSTELDFGTVKLDETCPAHDQAAPSAAGGTMPNFHGKSVKAARAALDSSTSITVNDATGGSRWVLVESNWQVCTQKPAAGAKVNGQPVTLNAVKYGERCP